MIEVRVSEIEIENGQALGKMDAGTLHENFLIDTRYYKLSYYEEQWKDAIDGATNSRELTCIIKSISAEPNKIGMINLYTIIPEEMTGRNLPSRYKDRSVYITESIKWIITNPRMYNSPSVIEYDELNRGFSSIHYFDPERPYRFYGYQNPCIEGISCWRVDFD